MSMRKIFGLHFLNVIESTYSPKVTIDAITHTMNVRSSRDQARYANPIRVKEFGSKEEFVGYVAQQAAEAWDSMVSTKNFEKIGKDIVEEIDGNKQSAKSMGDLYRETDYPQKVMTEEEIVSKVAEISNREAGSWEPWMVLKEICGVDLINTPDIATEENVELIRKNRVSPTNNNGIVRRRDKR